MQRETAKLITLNPLAHEHQFSQLVLTSSVPAPALMSEQADMRAPIMAGSTESPMLGTNNSASLFPMLGSPAKSLGHF